MDGPTRVPPRFVPTLTTVVDLQPVDPSGKSDETEVQARQPFSSDAVAPQTSPAPPIRVERALESRLPPALSSALIPVLIEEVPSTAPVINTNAGQAPAGVQSDDDGRSSALTEQVEPSVKPGMLAGPEQAPVTTIADAASLLSDPAPSEQGVLSMRAIDRLSEADAFNLEEELLHRVLQRVDLSLEERLTDVISATVQQQLDAMVPRLRSQVETVLRQLVEEAMALELSENPGSTSDSGKRALG